MAMSDWNDKQNGAYMTLSSLRKHEGAQSLMFDAVGHVPTVKILTQSEVDNPLQANFDFWLYNESGGVGCDAGLSLYFRYQDVDNYYRAMMYNYNWGGNLKIYFKLHRHLAGITTYGSEVEFIVGAVNHWNHWKILFCETAGTCYSMIYYDTAESDDAPNWVLKAESTRPSALGGGGGVGVGCYEQCDADDEMFLDLVKIYYA